MKAPQYERVIEDTGSTGFRRDVDAPAAAFGVVADRSPVTKGVMNLAGAVMDIEARSKATADQAAVQDKLNQFRQWSTDHLYNAEGGLFTLQGEQVRGMSQAASRDFAQKAEELEAGLTDSRQRQAFRLAAGQLTSSALGAVNRYEFQGLQKWKDATQKQALEQGMNAISAAWNDDAVCDTELQSMAKTVAEIYGPYGREMVEGKMSELVSKAMTTRLGRMLDMGENRMARTFFDAYRDELQGDDQAKVEKVLVDRERLVWAQETAEKMPSRFGTYTQASAWIRKNTEGPEQEMLLTKTRSIYADIEMRRAEGRRAAAEQRERYFDATYGVGSDDLHPADLNRAATDLASGRITKGQYSSLVQWNKLLGDRSNATSLVVSARAAKGLPPLTGSALDAEVRRAMGISDEQVQAAGAYLAGSVLSGSLTDKEATKLYASGLIDAAQRDQAVRLIDQQDKTNKVFSDRLTTQVESSLKNFPEGSAMAADTVRAGLLDVVGRFDPQSATYRSDVIKAAGDFVAECYADYLGGANAGGFKTGLFAGQAYDSDMLNGIVALRDVFSADVQARYRTSDAEHAKSITTHGIGTDDFPAVIPVPNKAR